MDENGKGTVNKRLVALGTLLLLTAVILASLKMGGTSSNTEPVEKHQHIDPTQDGNDDEIVASFRNLGFISDFMGASVSKESLNILAKEIQEDAKEKVTVTVSGRTISKTTFFPFDVCRFITNVSDDRSFDVAIAKKNEAFFGLSVHQTYPETSTQNKLYVVFIEEPEDRDATIDEITTWARNIVTGSIELTTIDL